MFDKIRHRLLCGKGKLFLEDLVIIRLQLQRVRALKKLES